MVWTKSAGQMLKSQLRRDRRSGRFLSVSDKASSRAGLAIVVKPDVMRRLRARARELGISSSELLEQTIEAALMEQDAPEFASLAEELSRKADQLEAVLADTNREIEETRAYFAAKHAA
jgi:hypothetical protein